ncbi:Os12g0140266 [Oryza sativa Japonica Group]|uniref:Os12g0140266 protein n=1 Tax=Oryza sativa subsp. japonica TaxID=39947 RepID=C7J9F1_ORYSJ|nr:Os12g0140266 [Oryza sativa Japonica Group]|eukprot:NP_001176785.1 Os12g0140266 [Oryza sativa Japonica Group]
MGWRGSSSVLESESLCCTIASFLYSLSLVFVTPQAKTGRNVSNTATTAGVSAIPRNEKVKSKHPKWYCCINYAKVISYGLLFSILACLFNT